MNKHFLKYIKILILCVLCIASLCACTNGEESANPSVPKIVATGFPQYDFARSVCGSGANIKMLIRPGSDTHSFEPSLSDIVAVEEADVFIYNGGESDVWVNKILSGLKNKDLKIISFMETEGINLYEEAPHFHSHNCEEKEHAHHHKDGLPQRYDEHLWLSPKNSIALIKKITQVLSEINPSMAPEYKNNSDSYIKRLESVHSELSEISPKSDHKLIAVADRFPFLYLVKDYGFDYMALFSACSSEGDAGPRHIAEMVREINEHAVSSVFHIELSNKKMAKVISEKTGAKILMLHSCQNVSKEEFKSGISFADLMEQNIKSLKEAIL